MKVKQQLRQCLMLKCQSFATLNLPPEKLKNLCDQAKRKITQQVIQKTMRESYGI